MNQELEQALQERNELERGNQSLVAEFSIMSRKYVCTCDFFVCHLGLFAMRLLSSDTESSFFCFFS